MTALAWVGIGVGAWLLIGSELAALIGRGIRAMDPGEDREQVLPAAVQQPDGQVDLLEGLPVEILGPREVDALFLRLVAPLDRELR